MLLAIVAGNVIGICLLAIASKLIFGDFLPFPHMHILDEEAFVKILRRFIDMAKREIICTTYAFSSVDFYKPIEEALLRATQDRRVTVRVIGADGIMPVQRQRNLENLGCLVTLVPKKLLDAKSRFYNHLLVSDGIHWFWLNPHPPEERWVHFGNFEMYDYDTAMQYRSEMINILNTHEEMRAQGYSN